VENRNNTNAEIASTVPFWNLTLDKNGGSASQIELITNTIQGETILDPDLIVLNNLTIKNGVTFDHNGNDVEIGSDFVIENGADYLYDGAKQNTTTINGVDNSLMAFYNRTGGTSDEQQFWNLIIDKPSGKTVTLLSGKTGTNREGNANNLLRINGDALKLLSGTLDQTHYSIRVYTDTLLNYDDLTLYEPTGATTDANSNSDNDLIKFRPDPFVLITADTSKFGNVRLNNGSNIVTLVSDVYMERMEYKHGRIDLKNQNLKIDKLFINLNVSEADWNSCGGCNSVEDMLILDGNTSDGGLSLYVNADQTLTFPIGIGTDGLDADVDVGPGTGNSKYTPAQVTISNYSDDGYITIRTVDDQLATTNPSGDILSYYWRVDYSDFSTLPTVTYQFTYYDDDVDGGNEAGYVPGKVLDDTPFTRSSEIASNINTSTNSITFNGDTGSGASPFTLELANYTAGAPARFTGNVEVYYTRVLGDAAMTNWRTITNWTLAPNGSLEPHDSRQPAAADYPKAGDIAYVGWVPYGDPAYDDGKPHGIEIDGTETFAELRFTQMLDMSDNPTARNYEYNFQFRPTVCINPGGAMNAQAVKGEGAFWMRSTGGSQVDPDFSSVDMGAFALEDSAYMIYESTNSSFVYDHIPSEVPNLMIAGNGWGSIDRDFEISSDVTVKEDFELLGDVNLVLSSGGSGDFYVEGDLRIIRLDINGNDSQGDGEIAFPNDASRTIEVLGDLELVNQNALVNIRSANAPVQVSNLIVHCNIIQDNTSGGGLQLSSGAGLDYVHLTLSGEGTHNFEQTSGADASLYSVTVNKGTDQSSSFSFDGNFTLDGPTSGVGVDKALTLENGIAVINNSSINIDLSTGDDDFNIPATAGLQVSDGQVNVSGDDSGIFLDGSLIIDGGTVDMDDGSGNGNNYIEYSSSESARIDISSGTLVVGSQVRGNPITTKSVLDYTQTGGTVVVGKNAAPEASRSVFEILNTGSNFTYTGGSLTLVRQNTASPGVAALRILPTFSDVTQTIVIGNSDTPAGQTSFGINANIPLAGLTITGGPNYPTGIIQVNPLNLTNTLTIDAGAELDGNALELILEGDFVNDGTYTPSANKTTFSGSSAQSISGTGTTAFYDFNKTGAGTLNSSIAFTINNDLTISEGIFDDNGNTIDVLGNAEIDATHQSTGGAGDGLRFSGSAEQQLTRSSSGTGTIGMLTLQNSNGLVIPEGNGYDFDIDGGLKLNDGVFNIGSSAVTLGENAWISTTSTYSLTNMVKTNSSFTDNGLGKIFPAGYTGMFTYPIGEVKYTPVTVDFSVSGGTSGSTVGSIAVRPANEYHPTVDDGIQGMPSQPDVNNVLQYYWTLRANNFTGFAADIKFYYDQTDVSVTESGYSEADYIPARILAFSNPTNLVNKYDASDLDETNNIISFSAASVFNGVDENGVSGDYFAGIDEAIPDNVATYTVDVNGGSVAGNSYDIDVPGGGAPSGAVVVIPNGYTLDFDIDNVKLYKTEIQDGGVLEVNDTEFHRLGIVEGIGTLKFVHNGAGNPSLPAGDFGTFFSCSGGGLEYGGTGSYDILGGIPDIRNLTLSGSGDRNLPNANVTVCEDLVVDGATVNMRNDRLVTVNNDANLLSGTINAPAGTNSFFFVSGSFQITGGQYYGSTSGRTIILGSLVLDGGALDIGSNTHSFRLWADFNFISGSFSGGTGNADIWFNSVAGIQSTSSVITGNFIGVNSFNILHINKQVTGTSLVLNGDIEITKELEFRKGIINTNGNKLILGSSAAVTSPSEDSYVNGRVVKTLSNAGDDFTFPIGSATRYRPAYVQDVSTGGLAWEAEYFGASAVNEASVTNLSPADPSILTMSSQEYWKISDGNSGPSGVTATVGLSWGAESDVSSAMAEREQLEVMVWNGTNWDDYGGANFSSGHSQSQGSFNSSSSVSFSEKIITLGSTDLSNPLPVELVSFTGKEQNGIVKLTWETASELNNDYFVIEHSTDGSNFVEVGKEEGAGTTQEKQTYFFLHRRPVYPNNYYRLKQVDFDGAYEYSDIIVVRLNKVLNEVKELDFVLYPNPTSGNSVNIRLNSIDHAQPLVIEVVNMNGTHIFTKRYDSIDLYGDIELSFGYGATRGVYIVKLIQESGTTFRRLMLK
ncbi:MAG: T9SS type A sorting domain-containing protein, partial [Cytophagales bacterium]|nr:T9SS type A sorting domain-containing protein [Cytophagales bacterium]